MMNSITFTVGDHVIVYNHQGVGRIVYINSPRDVGVLISLEGKAFQVTTDLGKLTHKITQG
jgi:hypothetical protein